MIVIDWVMKSAIGGQELGIQLVDVTIPDFDFADDICLLEDDPGKAQELLDLITHFAAKTGLTINVKKTKTMTNVENFKLYLDKEHLEQVENFIYLGSTITINNDCTPEIESRIKKAIGNSKNLQNLWCNRRIPSKIKERVYNASVKSTLLYSCDRGH